MDFKRIMEIRSMEITQGTYSFECTDGITKPLTLTFGNILDANDLDALKDLVIKEFGSIWNRRNIINPLLLPFDESKIEWK